MNKDQRKRIRAVYDKLGELCEEFEAISEEEQDKYDSMPEGLQASERGEAIQEAADAISDQVSAIEDIQSALEEYVE
jgi:hypothetical protein